MKCSLVWNTSTTSGLTLFYTDSTDYVKWNVPVNSASGTDMVAGIWTIPDKFECKGKSMHLSCLSYHLPFAETCVFSPQTHQTLYGEQSAVFGDKVWWGLISCQSQFQSMATLGMCQWYTTHISVLLGQRKVVRWLGQSFHLTRRRFTWWAVLYQTALSAFELTVGSLTLCNMLDYRAGTSAS